MADSDCQEAVSSNLDCGGEIDPTNVIINYVPTDYNERKLRVSSTGKYIYVGCYISIVIVIYYIYILYMCTYIDYIFCIWTCREC